jgi:hypothetical protein
MMKGDMEPICRVDNQAFKPASIPVRSSGFWLLIVIASHLPLAYLMRISPQVAQLHALSMVA